MTIWSIEIHNEDNGADFAPNDPISVIYDEQADADQEAAESEIAQSAEPSPAFVARTHDGVGLTQEDMDSGDYGTCEETDEIYHIDELVEVRASCTRNARQMLVCQQIVDSDYSYCEYSSEYFPNHEFIHTAYNTNISSRQYNNDDWFTCACCDSVLHHDDYGSGGNCTNCASDRQNDAIIKGYHSVNVAAELGFFDDGWKRTPAINVDLKSLYFGVELEVEVSDDEYYSREELAEKALEKLDDSKVVLMEDGSLSNGFEIITAPMSLNCQRALWKDFKVKGLVSHNRESCGIHVHVSRAALSHLTIGKLLVFLNSSGNDDFVETIAQRSAGRYCRKDYNKKITDCTEINDRYEALNLSNRHTVEFRIFKGNVRPERIIKNVEFCAALIEFCKSASAQELTDKAFIEWMNMPANKKAYPMLYTFMLDKGILETKHKKQALAELVADV